MKGEFEAELYFKEKSREHLHLAKSFGIFKLIIIVNKMDHPTVNWSKERYDEILAIIMPFLA
jgi:peptide chain release factor subunit 3